MFLHCMKRKETSEEKALFRNRVFPAAIQIYLLYFDLKFWFIPDVQKSAGRAVGGVRV